MKRPSDQTQHDPDSSDFRNIEWCWVSPDEEKNEDEDADDEDAGVKNTEDEA